MTTTSLKDSVLASISGPGAVGFLPFHDGSIVSPSQPQPTDDWHIDPAVKAQAQEAAASAATATQLKSTSKRSKKIKPESDGKASILGATFNLSNAVSRRRGTSPDQTALPIIYAAVLAPA